MEGTELGNRIQEASIFALLLNFIIFELPMRTTNCKQKNSTWLLREENEKELSLPVPSNLFWLQTRHYAKTRKCML